MLHAVLTAIGLMASSAMASDWIEAEWSGGAGKTPLTVYGTFDLPVFKPLLEAFSAQHPEYQLRYWLASSTAIDRHVSGAQRPDADLVFSSAVALQLRSVNGGQGLAHDNAPDAWRARLFPLAVEPIVAVYHTERAPWIDQVKSRKHLTELLTDRQSTTRATGVMYDPRQSGVGYLLATQDVEQSSAYWPMLDAIGSSGGWSLRCCSAQMIDSVESGTVDLAYNVLGSYAQARVQANPKLAIKVFGDYQLVMPRTAWIPKWSGNPSGAKEFIDFVRSDAGQALLPAGSRLNQLYRQVGAPRKSIRLTPALILYLDPAKRRQFLATWDTVVNPID